jgi:hypothetical protein
MGFSIVGLDYTNLDHCQWRIVHDKNKRLIVYNYPPVQNVYAAFLRHRTVLRKPEVVANLVEYMPITRSAKRRKCSFR